MSSRRCDLLLAGGLALLVGVAVWARLPGALHDSLWADEVYSARTIVEPSAREALYRVGQESSPPGWFFLGRVIHGLGFEPQTVRVLSVLAGAALTLLVFLYARRLLPLAGALLAGLLAALAYQPVFHGKELRPYALLAVLALGFVMALEAAAARPSRGRLVLLGAVSVAGALTHYFFLLAVAIGLVWLWASGSRPGRPAVTAAALAGLVPLLAWVPKMADQAGRVDAYFSQVTWERVLRLYSNVFSSASVWERAGDGLRYLVLVLVLAGTAVLARRSEGRLAAFMVVLPVAAAVAVSLLGIHVFTTRNLIVVAPFACIALAALPSAIPSVRSPWRRRSPSPPVRSGATRSTGCATERRTTGSARRWPTSAGRRASLSPSSAGLSTSARPSAGISRGARSSNRPDRARASASARTSSPSARAGSTGSRTTRSWCVGSGRSPSTAAARTASGGRGTSSSPRWSGRTSLSPRSATGLPASSSPGASRRRRASCPGPFHLAPPDCSDRMTAGRRKAILAGPAPVRGGKRLCRF